MGHLLSKTVAGAALIAASITTAQALPVQHDLGLSSATVLVSGGCGPYRHRGPYGGCRPGGGWGGPGWRGPGWHRWGWGHPGWHHWHRRW